MVWIRMEENMEFVHVNDARRITAKIAELHKRQQEALAELNRAEERRDLVRKAVRDTEKDCVYYRDELAKATAAFKEFCQQEVPEDGLHVHPTEEPKPANSDVPGQIEKVFLNGTEMIVLGLDFEMKNMDKLGQVTITFPLDAVEVIRTENSNVQVHLTVPTPGGEVN
ncbi:hypothetical protein [Corynebacterium sp.]|uniref:hypothetical protein n=1 Tax=Corynebacterium sp. TaxID=1720 RepID=UPI0028A8E75B|nr:hypothetical protein [Corynebacterium sp.]